MINICIWLFGILVVSNLKKYLHNLLKNVFDNNNIAKKAITEIKTTMKRIQRNESSIIKR